MTEIPKCPTCGRRPSQGTNASIRFYGAEGCDIEEEGCPDPIHNIADQGPALKAERDELRKQLQMVESDMAEAAGELRVPMPTPGTQKAKMLGAALAGSDPDAGYVGILQGVHWNYLSKQLLTLIERLETAEHRLMSLGYRRTCDIPACNCGDRWAHKRSSLP